MDYSLESKTRMKKIQDLKNAGVIPYANNYRGKQDIDYIISKKDEAKNADALMENGAIGEYKTAGRLISYRGHGKLAFGKIMDHKATIQVCFVKDLFEFHTGRPPHPQPLPFKEGGNIVGKTETIEVDGQPKTPFKMIDKLTDVGDYIGVIGDLFVTKHGELTLFVKEFQILAKAVRPLPEKFHGVTDQETIYRQRYLDLITNEESYQRMLLKSKFLKSLRDFYIEEGFIEVTTPTLGTAASGAAAKPFITHHNDFGEDVYLRIAPEIGLKMATVGRYEKVFEFATNFRNEGSDPSHMQEFQVVEHYVAWWNFEDNIKFTERMFDHFFDDLGLDRRIPVKDKEGNEKIVDFSTPFKRIDYVEGVKNACGIDVTEYAYGEEERLISDIKSKGIEFEGIEAMAVPTLIDYLYKKVLRPSIVGPAFVYNYPKTMQPLARQNDANENIVEQFQLLVNGWEINKAYSELVDPKVQAQNFDDQSGAIELGDEEATQGDDDFVLAMEYGMPCQSGFGMGFDRIFSILTQQDNLRDVVLFPLMKSEKKNNEKKETNLAVALLNKEANMEPWQEMNAIGNLAGSYAARVGKSLFYQDELVTKDGVKLKLNPENATMIKNAHSGKELVELMRKAGEVGIDVVHFVREMIESSSDEKILESVSGKDFTDVEYLGILLFGPKKIVESLTEDFELYSGNSLAPKVEEKINTFTEIPSRKKILKMVDKYATATKQHLLQVGDVMEYFAEKLGEDSHYWWTVGVLHDIDWDYIEKDGDAHCKEEFVKMCNEFEVPESIIKDVQSHLYGLDRGLGVKPDTLVRKYLSSVDELSGFMWAYFRMTPYDNPQELKPKSIKKKIKDKRFAAGVDREEVKNCEKLLGIDLGEFIDEVKIGLSKGDWEK